MAVIRIEKSKDFTVMSNYHLRDLRLSNKAVGLLSKILSLPDQWKYSIKGLACICKDGEDGIKAQLKELEAAGYLKRQQKREKGCFTEMEYVIFEKPSFSEAENELVNDSYIEKQAQAVSEDPPENSVKQEVLKQIDYDSVLQETAQVEILDDLVSLMVELLSLKSDTIRISKIDYPFSLITDRIRQITKKHILCVISAIKNAGEIKNKKEYYKTLLFNIPININKSSDNAGQAAPLPRNNQYAKKKTGLHNFEERERDQAYWDRIEDIIARKNTELYCDKKLIE